MNTVSATSLARHNSFACCCTCGKRATLDAGSVWTMHGNDFGDGAQLRCRSCSILAGYDALIYR